MLAVDNSDLPNDQLVRQSLRIELARKLGPDIGVACGDVDGALHELWPVESAAILKAVPRRQREFAAGRKAAREAMQRIGIGNFPIPCGPDRAPAWPSGLVGSISHTQQICIAVAGRVEEVGGIGIDVEEFMQIDPDLWTSICTTKERAFLQNQPMQQWRELVTKIFCAKEAFYKWQYPFTGRLLDFQDVEVDLEPQSSSFSIKPVKAPRYPDLISPVTGGTLIHQTRVIAWVLGHQARP